MTKMPALLKQRRRATRGDTKGQGFASMSPDKRRQIASQGGKKAHQLGRAHQWTPTEAQVAGRKGGKISRRRAATKAEE